MGVQTLPDAAAVAAAAVEFVSEKISAAVRDRGVGSLVVSGGSTPQALFSLLAEPPYRDTIPWSKLHIFWADERFVPPDDPGSNYGQADDLLLSRVPLPEDNIHRMHGEWPSQRAAASYTEQLWAFQRTYDPRAPHPWPRFDLVLLGLGADGHTASLFPGSSPDEQRPVVAVTAVYDGRPAQRITLTPSVINDAREVIFLVTGTSKAEAVDQTLNGPRDPVTWPAQRIQPQDGEVHWLVDKAAGRLLVA